MCYQVFDVFVTFNGLSCCPSQKDQKGHCECCSLRQMKKRRKALQKGGSEQVGACVYLWLYLPS